MVGFIEPVGTSFQSASAERSELLTSSIRMKTRISSMTFFLFIYANSLYGEERRPFQTSGSHGGFRLKDIGPHLSNANISRLLRELAQKLISTRSALILTGEPLQLPQDIERLAVLFDLELPDDDEMRMVVRSVLDSFGRRQQVRVDLS